MIIARRETIDDGTCNFLFNSTYERKANMLRSILLCNNVNILLYSCSDKFAKSCAQNCYYYFIFQCDNLS